jgi:hypothetical protein
MQAFFIKQVMAVAAIIVACATIIMFAYATNKKSLTVLIKKLYLRENIYCY